MNYTLLEDYEDVEIQVTTSNPERKYKKKLRKFKAQYEKNPSRELSIKIANVEQILTDLNKPKTVIKKKVRMKKRNVDKSIKRVKKKRTLVVENNNRYPQYNNISTNAAAVLRVYGSYKPYIPKRKVRKVNDDDDDDAYFKQCMKNRPLKSYNKTNLTRITYDFTTKKQQINDKYLLKLYKLCGNEINHSILREIRVYFRNPDKEWLYIKLMGKYGAVGLKNIQKTIYTLFHNLPTDIIKIIWKFYFETIYFKAGIMIENFKKKIDVEKDIYNTRKNLYA